jgi:hypothetical protein
MSQAHKDAFERIKIEHQAVCGLLTQGARKPVAGGFQPKDPSTGAALSARDVMETAVATCNEAYALLLMATAEGFLRRYLDSIGVDLGPEPKLSMLIDKCKKEFNDTDQRLPIHDNAAADLHNLRQQRNNYAHGHGTGVFPPVAAVVTRLGRFFAEIP